MGSRYESPGSSASGPNTARPPACSTGSGVRNSHWATAMVVSGLMTRVPSIDGWSSSRAQNTSVTLPSPSGSSDLSNWKRCRSPKNSSAKCGAKSASSGGYTQEVYDCSGVVRRIWYAYPSRSMRRRQLKRSREEEPRWAMASPAACTVPTSPSGRIDSTDAR